MMPTLSNLTVQQIAGQTREDLALILDFLTRYEKAVLLAAESSIPLQFFEPQKVLEGIPRISALIYRDKKCHPKFLLDGKVGHIKWAWLLSLMYPGGESEALLSDGVRQGHPDYLPAALPEFYPAEGIVIEVKTCGDDRWRAIQKRPDPLHVRQVLEYLALAQKPLCLLAYENRSSLLLHLWVIRPVEGRSEPCGES